MINDEAKKLRNICKWGILIFVLILYLLPFYYAKLFAWPCAEDYGGEATLNYNGFSLIQSFKDAWYYYFNWGGRYLCYAGGQLGQLLVLHHLAYVWCCIIASVFAFIPILGIMCEIGRRKCFSENLFWALLFFSATYSSLGGLAQTFYWFSNIFTTTMGLIALLYSIWSICCILNHENFSYVAFFGAMIAAFIAPEFYEQAAIAQFYIAVTILFCAWKFQRHKPALMILATWQMIWVVLMFMAPGNLQRHGIQEVANSIPESLFMSFRALIGIVGHTMFSPWLLVLSAFIIAHNSGVNSLLRGLSSRQRLMLALVALVAPVTIAVLHVVARYPIVFNGRAGDSILVISWIGVVWVGILYSDWIKIRLKQFKITPYLTVLAVVALFCTGNTFRLWQNIFNGNLKTFDSAMSKRHTDFEHGKGREVVVSPFACAAWPAQKADLGDISYNPNGGVNLAISKLFSLKSVRLLPSLSDVRQYALEFPEKLSTKEKSILINDTYYNINITVIHDVLAGEVHEDWLDFGIEGNEQALKEIKYLRIITMTSECFSLALNYFSKKQMFARLSLDMAAAVYGSKRNHVCHDLQNDEVQIKKVKMDKDKWRWSILIPVNGSKTGETKLVFFSLDTKTYFKGYCDSNAL